MREIREKRESHSIMMYPSSWKVLKALGHIQGKGAGEVVETALWKLIEAEGFNPMYFKIMASAEPCDPEENKELTEILDRMTEEDLKIVKSHELPEATHEAE